MNGQCPDFCDVMIGLDRIGLRFMEELLNHILNPNPLPCLVLVKKFVVVVVDDGTTGGCVNRFQG